MRKNTGNHKESEGEKLHNQLYTKIDRFAGTYPGLSMIQRRRFAVKRNLLVDGSPL